MQTITMYLRSDSVNAKFVDSYNQPISSIPAITRGMRVTLVLKLLDGDGNPMAVGGYASWDFVLAHDFLSATPPQLRVTEGIKASGNSITIPLTETNTEELIAILGNQAAMTIGAELAGFETGETTPGFLLQFDISVRNRRGDAGTGTPTPVADGNYSASQIDALFAAKLEVEFSVDGESWGKAQSQESRFYRFRNAMVGLDWSDTLPLIIGPVGAQGIQGIQGIKGDRSTIQIGAVTTTPPESQSTIENIGDNYDAVFNFSLPQGVKGDKGIESYLYTAYAENPAMAGFSLTPANHLKCRAEIISRIPLNPPTFADFALAQWVKYLGEDGAVFGDVLVADQSTSVAKVSRIIFENASIREGDAGEVIVNFHNPGVSDETLRNYSLLNGKTRLSSWINGGGSPGAALKDLPVTVDGFADNTCYLIRRTAETSACTIPAGTNNALRNLLLLGMPNPNDAMYAFVPEEAKTAWALDAAEYANIKSALASGQFIMDGIRQFLLHRIYLFRDNINADEYIFSFNSSDYSAVIALENCKFGSRGIDLDKDDYTGSPITASRLKAYLSCYYVHMLSVKNCIFNYSVTGNTNDPHGVYCRTAKFLQVENVKVHAPMCYNSYEYRPLQLTDSGGDVVDAVVRNVEMKIYFNGTYEYMPLLFYITHFQHALIENITVSMGTDKLGVTRPANLRLNSRMIYLNNIREFAVCGITVNLPDLWRLESSGNVFCMAGCYYGTYLPGVVKDVKNISVTLAQGENGIGPCNTYAEIQSGNRNYHAAVMLEFTNRDTYTSWKTPQVDNVSVIHPRGRALYLYNSRGTNIDLQGIGCFIQSLADVNNLDTCFPGHALYAGEGSTVRVRNLKINLENPAYIYSNDPVVSSTYSDRSFVFADVCNAPMRPNVTDSSQNSYSFCAFVSNNEGENGHFIHRSPHGICDTWNVHREGGGAACLKLWNNTFNTASSLSLGQKPFKGMMLTPNRTGRHVLRLHVAWKGYPDATDLYRRFMVSATLGGTTLWSNLQGRWLDDATAVWVNDSNLTQKVLEIPVNIIEVNPVDIRMYFSWYSNAGFLYVDPAIELIAEEAE